MIPLARWGPLLGRAVTLHCIIRIMTRMYRDKAKGTQLPPDRSEKSTSTCHIDEHTAKRTRSASLSVHQEVLELR